MAGAFPDEVENEIIDQRGHQGDQAETQQDEVNLHRVGERIEVRRLVSRLVDGANGDFHQRHAELTGGDQHFQFEFVTSGIHIQQAGGESGRNGSQAGLRVAQCSADQQTHQVARQEITETAAGRYFGVEGAASKDERVGGFAEGRFHPCDVFGMMLSIGVGSDDT